MRQSLLSLVGCQIYVTWKGDTETQTWRFYVFNKQRESYVGQKERKSFETTLRVKGNGVQNIVAEAFAENGAVLTKSDATTDDPLSAIKYEVPFHYISGASEMPKSRLKIES